MVTVDIEDVPLMINVIDTYIEETKEAKEMSIEDDRTLDTTDKLLDVMSQYDKDIDTLVRLKKSLENSLSSPRRFRRRRWRAGSH